MTPDKLRDCDACGGTGKPASGLPCMCGGTGRAVDAVDYLRKAYAAALEEIERLKVLVAEAPWQRAGVDDWRCRECWATVCRGIYPTAFGHAAHCSHSIRDVVDRAEKAECRAERLQAKVDALMLEYCPDEMTPEQLAEWEKHQAEVAILSAI